LEGGRDWVRGGEQREGGAGAGGGAADGDVDDARVHCGLARGELGKGVA